MLAGAGAEIAIATMTPGDCGTTEYSPEEISEIRRREAAGAAALVGAEYHCLEFRDLAVFNDDRSRRRVVELLRRTRPDIILAASPVDYMCDHEAASTLVRDAAFGAPAPNYRTGEESATPPLPAIPHLYLMDPIGGVDRENRTVVPDFIVDVSTVFERKRGMLAQHRSQREWLAKHHSIDDYLDNMERATRERGALAGVAYGEGWRQYKGHPYPTTPVLQEMLAGFVLRAAAA